MDFGTFGNLHLLITEEFRPRPYVLNLAQLAFSYSSYNASVTMSCNPCTPRTTTAHLFKLGDISPHFLWVRRLWL